MGFHYGRQNYTSIGNDGGRYDGRHGHNGHRGGNETMQWINFFANLAGGLQYAQQDYSPYYQQPECYQQPYYGGQQYYGGQTSYNGQPIFNRQDYSTNGYNNGNVQGNGGNPPLDTISLSGTSGSSSTSDTEVITGEKFEKIKAFLEGKGKYDSSLSESALYKLAKDNGFEPTERPGGSSGDGGGSGGVGGSGDGGGGTTKTSKLKGTVYHEGEKVEDVTANGKTVKVKTFKDGDFSVRQFYNDKNELIEQYYDKTGKFLRQGKVDPAKENKAKPEKAAGDGHGANGGTTRAADNNQPQVGSYMTVVTQASNFEHNNVLQLKARAKAIGETGNVDDTDKKIAAGIEQDKQKAAAKERILREILEKLTATEQRKTQLLTKLDGYMKDLSDKNISKENRSLIEQRIVEIKNQIGGCNSELQAGSYWDNKIGSFRKFSDDYGDEYSLDKLRKLISGNPSQAAAPAAVGTITTSANASSSVPPRLF